MGVLPKVQFVFCLLILGWLTGCGIVVYPGQPGMVTNNFNKLDFEYLDEPGLFVYETVYDNRTGGSGVGAVVSKLYPLAKTYTSNVRTNSDGTLYRSKVEYEGAQIQMISVPNLGQVHLSANHQLMFFVDYATSLDETDDRNITEAELFKQPNLNPTLSARAFEGKKMRWDLLKAGNLLPIGNLSYELTAVELKPQKFIPSQSVSVETNFFGNAVKTQLNSQVKAEFAQFIEAHFPKGYKGQVSFFVKGSPDPITMFLGINTVKTLEGSGVKVQKDVTESAMQEILGRIKSNP